MHFMFGNLLCCCCCCVGPNFPLRRQLVPAAARNIVEVCSLPTATVLHAVREAKHLPDRLSAGQGFLTRHPTPIIFPLTAQQFKKRKDLHKKKPAKMAVKWSRYVMRNQGVFVPLASVTP